MAPRRKLAASIALGLLAVIVVAWIAAERRLTLWAREEILNGVTAGTGQDGRIGSIDLSLLRGALDIEDLEIDAPTSGGEVRIGRLHVRVRPFSLLKDDIEVPRIDVDDLVLRVHLAVVDHVRVQSRGRGSSGEGRPPTSRRVLLGRLELHDAEITVIDERGRLRGRGTIPELVVDPLGEEGRMVPIEKAVMDAFDRLMDFTGVR